MLSAQNRPITILLFICILKVFVNSQNYTGPIPKPISGYGADGTLTVKVDSIENPAYAGKFIKIHYPTERKGAVPTIFYSHAYGGHDPSSVAGLLNFIAQKGYAAVFVPYQTAGITMEYRYNNLINGFALAVKTYKDIIDTTRVGFMGWSFGGGATIGIGHKFFTENHWGESGRFLFPLAQWYSDYVTQEQLLNFPADTKLLTIVFDKDDINDHRMAIDIFNNISIPDSDKDYIRLLQDTVSGYAYVADHSVPSTRLFDAYDYYAIYRLLDALCDYTFNKVDSAKNIALGNGSEEQVKMPDSLHPLIATMHPVPLYPESSYTFPCGGPLNSRRTFCGLTTISEDADNKETINDINHISIYPNPFNPVVTIRSKAVWNKPLLCIYNIHGALIFSEKLNGHALRNGIMWNASHYPAGNYLVRITDEASRPISKLKMILSK
ncbi:MAG: T9SS type A sorting domain-containing protein [Fibrobacteres bacterium]|nr:T9SS type A sorting domain-containing protein [Fibrobacterota bacterium]